MTRHPKLRSVPAAMLRVLVFLVAALCPVAAAEHWQRVVDPIIPAGFVSLFTVPFKDAVYVFGQSATDVTALKIFRWDGRTWQTSAVPPLSHFEAGTASDDAMWVFGNDWNTNETVAYRSFDGTTWTRVPTRFPNGLWLSAVIFGDHVYVVQSQPVDGRIIRINRQTLASDEIQIAGRWVTGLVAFHDRLYAWTSNYSDTIKGNLFRSSDGLTWEGPLLPDGKPYDWIGPAVAWNDRLYFRYSESLWVSRTAGQDDLEKDASLPTGDPTPFVFQNSLHVHLSEAGYQDGSRIFQRDQNKWRLTVDNAPLMLVPTLGGVADVGDASVLANGTALYVFRRGTVGLSAVDVIRTPLVAGQKDSAVLAMETAVNFSDHLDRFVVRNAGSARSGQDVTLKLVRNPARNVSNIFETLAELVSTDGGRTWQLPGPLATPINDGDRLYVTATIADHPTDGATLDLRVEPHDIAWAVNGQFSLDAAVDTAGPQTISTGPSAAPGTIDGVVIFPMPAKDTVNFLYDLSSTSDVTVRVTDRNGALVDTIRDPSKPAGLHAKTVWSASSIAPGAYNALVEIRPSDGAVRRYKRKILIQP